MKKNSNANMKKSSRVFWTVFLSATGAFFLFVLLCMFGVFGKLPSLKELENPTILQSSEVFAADGTLMGNISVSGATVPV
jgi:penicillin-binding protein 1A